MRLVLAHRVTNTFQQCPGTRQPTAGDHRQTDWQQHRQCQARIEGGPAGDQKQEGRHVVRLRQRPLRHPLRQRRHQESKDEKREESINHQHGMQPGRRQWPGWRRIQPGVAGAEIECPERHCQQGLDTAGKEHHAVQRRKKIFRALMAAPVPKQQLKHLPQSPQDVHRPWPRAVDRRWQPGTRWPEENRPRPQTPPRPTAPAHRATRQRRRALHRRRYASGNAAACATRRAPTSCWGPSRGSAPDSAGAAR